jgi:asparagine synthase (glutamine-hydrolysing)
MSLHWHESKPALWPGFRGAIRMPFSGHARRGSRILDRSCRLPKSWLVEDLLMKADKMSMATSLELRVPFLDYRLVEWANRQPIGAKIGRLDGRNVTKRVLRRFAKSRLPREIIDRPKKGFPVPVLGWLKDDGFNSWAREHLMGNHSRLKHLFRAEEMQRQLHRAMSGDRKAADKSWLLIVLETWLREFDVDVAEEIPVSPNGVLVAG